MDDRADGLVRPTATDRSLLFAMSAVAVLIVCLCAFAVIQLRDAAREQARAMATASSEASSAATAARVNGLGVAVAEQSAMVVSDGPAALRNVRAPGFLRIDHLSADATPARERELLAAGVDTEALRPSLDRARDSVGAVWLSPSVGEPPAPAVVHAIFRRADGSLSLTPSEATTEARRAEIDGYVVGTIDLDYVVVAPNSEAWTLEDGPTLMSARGDISGDTVSSEIDVIGRRWRLTSSVEPIGWRDAGAAVVAVGLLAMALLAIAAGRMLAALRDRQREADHARRRALSVATLSGVVQQSHDLGEVLPGLAIQLSDVLGLDGLSLAVATPEGGFREFFAHGATADVAGSLAVAEVDVVPAGATASLHLHRADRSIAVLRVVTGRRLEADDLDLLRIASEIVTSAVVTARSLEQQQDAVARLHVLDELKTAFLGTASHELRTPVTAISGFALVLADRWDQITEAERRVFADRIASNARALEVLVQDLLDFARLERGDHAMVLEPLELSGLVAGVLERLSPVLQSHVIEGPGDEPVHVAGDRAALERVVTNLVTNAVKFSPEGSTITVGVRAAGAVATLEVDDEGPGVPLADRDKIFVRFFRGSSQAVVRTRGVGIGLSVVEDFVARMGGAITVDDSPSGGARFRVELSLLDPPTIDPSPSLEEEHDVPTA